MGSATARSIHTGATGERGLNPSPEADRASLLRRASLDLTGLPPSLEEQAAYLADTSPNAYEKQVDRLLASPQYGERWAALWLDLARYADSKGYEADRERPGVWPYRDWVIDAFNRNLPYDQFVIKQLAGDLLPNATFEDRIATSFHRQTPNNDEGGTDDEEFRLVEVMDRSATTWSVLNGLTMNCVQCHSHPYDPIRHAEYYKSLAFFNTSRDADVPEDTPVLLVPKDKSRYPDTSRLQQEISTLTRSIVDSGRQLDAQTPWIPLPISTASASEALALQYEAGGLENELAHLPNEKLTAKKEEKLRKDLVKAIAETRKTADSKAARTPVPFQIRDGEMLAAASTPGKSVYELTAKADAQVLTALRIEVLPLKGEAARHTPEDGFIVDKIEAWAILPDGHQQRITFRSLVWDSEENLQAAVKRGIKTADTAKDGKETWAFAANPNLFQTRWTVGIPASPLRLSAGSRIKVQLTQTQNASDKPAIIKRARLAASEDSRWTSLTQDPKVSGSLTELTKLTGELAKIPSVELPVAEEQAGYESRQTLEFERGNFLTKTGPPLTPDVPGLFPKLPDGAPRNRLTLAKWFFSPEQPLTARTAVNRYWEQLFGTELWRRWKILAVSAKSRVIPNCSIGWRFTLKTIFTGT